MLKNNYRDLKIAALLKEELALILRDEIKDPRVKNITISEIEVSKGAKEALVYFSTLLKPERASEVLEGLIHSKSFIRFHLKKNLNLKIIPELRFKYDSSFDYSDQINRKIIDLKKQNRFTIEVHGS